MTNPQNQDLLEAISIFAQKVDEKFEKIDARFESLERTMVTKNYLHYQLADLKGELEAKINKLDRKFDQKFNTLNSTLDNLTLILSEKSILTTEDVKNLRKQPSKS